MPDVATIRRNTPTRTATGGYADAWSDLTTVACRVDPVSTPQEQTVASRLETETPAVVVVPHGTDVTDADQIVVDGVTYEVGGIVPGSQQTNVKAVCKALT